MFQELYLKAISLSDYVAVAVALFIKKAVAATR